MTRTKLSWDGEKIKQEVKVEDIKFTPKEILDSLDNVRSQIKQMEEQIIQLENNIFQIKNNLKQARSFERERKEFESKCEEIQLNKLKKYVRNLKEELKIEAEMEATEIINKDLNAYTDQHKINQKYVLFQKKLATNKKIADKISPRIIKKYLFEEPIFENPFK